MEPCCTGGVRIFTSGLLKLGLPDPPPDEEDIRLGRREKGINALGIYALGFMSHAILDRETHPYIVYKSGFVSPKRPETGKYARFHAFFERIIDTLMLKKLRGKDIKLWDQGILAEACEKPPLGLKELLARALILAFPERAGKDDKLNLRINNTFLDCACFYRLTAPDKTVTSEFPQELDPSFLALFYPEDLPQDIDFLNLENRPWYYPLAEGEEDRRSFPEIYAAALKAASDTLSPVIIRYLETGIFPIREAAQAIGNGGLSILNREGKPCAPTRSDPLPLERVLWREAERRGIRAKAAES